MEDAVKFLIGPFTSDGFFLVIIRILDILIVAYLIYRTLLMIRGTRTIAIAIGFLAIYLTYLFSAKLGLSTLSNLFYAFFSKLSIFVIFALIIFQEDIRRALGRMGSLPRTGPFIHTESIEEVVQAAGAMASKRIGAIIIFEGKADLDSFVSEGVVVDSALTRESLFSIFIPSFENPLHDGAVIIRGYRIYKAAAIIRHLTPRSDLPKSLGTRHRAAIGITEETDAVAIVVSEEKGTISVCFAGNIVQSVSMADLRSLLDARFRRHARGGALGDILKFFKRKEAPVAKKEKMRDSEPVSMDVKVGKAERAKKEKEDKSGSLEDPEVFAEFMGSK